MARAIGSWPLEPHVVMLEARVRELEIRLRAVEEQLADMTTGQAVQMEQDAADASREVSAVSG